MILLHQAGTSSRRGKIRVVEAAVVRFTSRRVLDPRCGFAIGGSTSRKLSDSLSSFDDRLLLLCEADSEGLGDVGDREKRRKLRRRNKHVLIRVPFSINRCSSGHPGPEGAGFATM